MFAGMSWRAACRQACNNNQNERVDVYVITSGGALAGWLVGRRLVFGRQGHERRGGDVQRAGS